MVRQMVQIGMAVALVIGLVLINAFFWFPTSHPADRVTRAMRWFFGLYLVSQLIVLGCDIALMGEMITLQRYEALRIWTFRPLNIVAVGVLAWQLRRPVVPQERHPS